MRPLLPFSAESATVVAATAATAASTAAAALDVAAQVELVDASPVRTGVQDPTLGRERQAVDRDRRKTGCRLAPHRLARTQLEHAEVGRCGGVSGLGVA